MQNSLISLESDTPKSFNPIDLGMQSYRLLESSFQKMNLPLAQLAFFMMILLGIGQVLRGRTLPPALSLFQIAFTIAQALQIQSFQKKIQNIIFEEE